MRMNRGWLGLSLAVMPIVLGISGEAHAQSKVIDDNPYLKLEKPRDWTVDSIATLTSYQDTSQNNVTIEVFRFEDAAVIFPVIRETSNARCPIVAPSDISFVEARLEVNNVVVTEKPVQISGYHSDAHFIRLNSGPVEGRKLRMFFKSQMKCYETVFDERAAMEVPWPTRAWPAEAQSAMGPQMFVDFTPDGPLDMSVIKDLINEWTNGQDPHKLKPVMLAKYLAGKVQEHVQFRDDGINRGGRDLGRVKGGRAFTGLDLNGAVMAAQTGRASPWDAVCLLAAVYRQVGLPARIVIAYNEGDPRDGDPNPSGNRRYIAWVEFCLFDERITDPETRAWTWVPVDVINLRRRRGSRMGDLNRPWKYFGTHDELDYYVPIALHFHPPTNVRAYGSPAFYGWQTRPFIPSVTTQTLVINVNRTPSRGGRP